MMKTIQNCQFTAHSRNGLPQEVPVTVPAQSRHYSTYFTSEADERSGGWIFTVTLTYIATVDSYLTEQRKFVIAPSDMPFDECKLDLACICNNRPWIALFQVL